MKPSKPDGRDTTWNVRPRNLVQIVLSERFDLPSPHCYVGINDYETTKHGGDYKHRPGSARGGFASFEEAERVAMALYEEEYAKEQKKL